jgi:Lon protease-like protein
MASLETGRSIIRARLDRLPIFPLAETVLIPGGAVPLRVFEPRYRKLVRDSLAQDRLLAVVLLAPSGGTSDTSPRPRVCAATGVGLIRTHEELPDGGLVILLEGKLRARIVEELRTREPYRIVRAVAIEEEREVSGEELHTSMRVLRNQVSQLAGLLPDDSGAPLVAAVNSEADPGRLADLLAAALLVDPLQRQRFLEEARVGRRLDSMVRTMAEVVSVIADRRGVRAAN